MTFLGKKCSKQRGLGRPPHKRIRQARQLDDRIPSHAAVHFAGRHSVPPGEFNVRHPSFVLSRATAGVALCFLLAASASNMSCGPSEAKSRVPDDAILIRGAGATFPAPLYERWVQLYQPKNEKVWISYEAVGSGAGTQQFLAEDAPQDERIEFGASDAGLSDEQMAGVQRGARLVPMAAGSIVIAYNMPDLGGPLRLSRELYVDIFSGKVTRWNDPRLAAENPGLNFPSKKRDIVLAARLDSSGTTFAFTNHLSAVSDDWRDRGPGPAKLVDWPGSAMRAPGNEGVAGLIQRNPGTIGYVEYGVAVRAGLSMAALQNKAGNYVEPTGASGMSTLVNAELPENLRAFFPDPDGQQSYPIVTYTWILLYEKYDDPSVARELKAFLHWCLTEGQAYNEPLGFIRLPPEIAERARAVVDEIQ